MLRTNILIALVVVLLLGLNVNTYADQATIDKIEAAYARTDVVALEELLNTTGGYDKNLAGYRLSIVYDLEPTKKQADETIQQVVDRLREHLKARPDDVESWTLLSNAYGLMIAYNPSRGMTHGPLASQGLGEAYALDRQNPRVKLADGIAKYHTPEMFGGSKSEAVEILTKAITAYPNDVDSGFHWGWADAYIWRGLARFQLGDKNNAISDWRDALKIVPGHKWAKRLLEKHQ